MNSKTKERVAGRTTLVCVGDPDVIVTYNISGGSVSKGTVTFELGSHNFTSEVNQSGTIGGSAVNAAVAANRAHGMDIKVAVVTFLGKDRFTPLFDDLFKSEGITDIYPHRNDKVPNDKTNEMVVQGGSRFFQHKVYERNKVPRYAELTVLPDMLLLAGVNWPWLATYEETVTYAQKKKVALALYPGANQVRDLKLSDRELQELQKLHTEYRGVALSEIKRTFFEALEFSSILIVNEQEAQSICSVAVRNFSQAANIQDLLRTLQKLGPRIVCIEDGSFGSSAIDGHGKNYEIGPVDSQTNMVRDVAAIHDTYAGTFLSSYLSKKSISEAMKEAALNAHAVAGSQNILSAMLSSSEIDEMAAQKTSPRSTIV